MVSPDCEGSPQSDIANYDVDARLLATDLACRNGLSQWPIACSRLPCWPSELARPPPLGRANGPSYVNFDEGDT